MTVVRRQRLKDLLYLQERMNRVFEDSLKDKEGLIAPGEWIPPVDVFEDDSSIILKAELPGIKREDIALDVNNSVLTISGEKGFEHEKSRESYHMIERHYGSFRRSFSIPDTVDSDKIEARYEKGVLEIILPKLEGSVSRQIPISKG
ncbi:MAG: Hsp20/alpha crystallin family protein [Deltaproteobacteria bacterium]|nr:Hsp20/alpha crystallin family protein [Deltaproteobacteria bacterium]